MAAQDPRSPSLVGAILSRKWRLLRELGEGGMAHVYAAESVENGLRVAVKVLRHEYLAERQVLTRFLEEGTTSMRLVHPNIVRMIDCSSAEDGTPFLVMELLEGVPLGAYTQGGGRVPPAQAVPILHGILAGLTAAHAQGVVHRDLKPDNVFLTRGPEGTFVVKVLDFGIAKVMDVAGGMGHRTRTGMLLGTPAYMSPEQIQNARDVDQRADVWSAGVMFYEMLTGRVAFPAPTQFARLEAILTADPEPVDRVDRSLAPFSPFIERALRKDRDERFSTALEMARALTAAAPHLSMRTDGLRASAGPPPLSRLPEVASLLAPSKLVAPNLGEPAGRVPSVPPGVSSSDPSQGIPKTRGGTLASQVVGPAVSDPSPIVVITTPKRSLGETLPSKDAPPAKAGGGVLHGTVSAKVVVLLVAGALGAGFLFGWAVGRM